MWPPVTGSHSTGLETHAVAQAGVLKQHCAGIVSPHGPTEEDLSKNGVHFTCIGFLDGPTYVWRGVQILRFRGLPGASFAHPQSNEIAPELIASALFRMKAAQASHSQVVNEHGESEDVPLKGVERNVLANESVGQLP